MRGLRLGYYSGRGLGVFGAPRYMPPSPSAQPVFVGPAIEPPIPKQRLLSPAVVPLIPASQGGPKAKVWSPPVQQGSDYCTGVICPAGKMCQGGICVDVTGSPPPPVELPPVDQTMKVPAKPAFVLKPGAPVTPEPAITFRPEPGPSSAPPTFGPPVKYNPGGGDSTPRGTQSDDQRQTPVLEPADGSVAPASGGGGLAIAAIAAYFLFF